LNATNRALVLEEEDPRYYAQLGEIHAKMKQTAQSENAAKKAAELKARPGYQPRDPYSSEMRPTDDAAMVKKICG
jgi:hypothetical protein